ncbi:tetratricopeptide repeat protein [Oceanihabitans sediminis]|uniref:tetratricopeptide repeat protein n=1 Tax=Oceanihabitans sediminis TaxID=1812012 RepID=UPI000931A685|nr:tetratricopeptide repeat protein [Oceanihabitans sediminis]MDX1277291.1 tetratricopeptide repeat protein [Oceanihabitans sediminis]
MKNILIVIFTFFSIASFAQDSEEQNLLSQKKANDLVYKANVLVDNDELVSAEMEYRKAISEQPNYAVGAYNLGNSYYKQGNYEEALYRLKQTARHATTKDEKHRAFHNIGNVLMQNKQCKEAAEAFKSALRNNPSDDETRYNYALAKECAEQQQDEEDQQDENKDEENQDDQENQDNQDQEDKEDKKEQEDQGDQEEDNKDENSEDEGDKDKNEGEDKEDEDGNPKDENQDQGEGDKDKKENPQPQPGQLSPQQIKNLLEAMNDQEQKVQDKINAQKEKGAKVQTEKDW